MAQNKMQWFVEKYQSNKLDYIINKTSEQFGTIVMPTGTGKSGVVYEDIVKRIDTHKAGRKIVFNISCPILKLTQQFIKDLFDVFAVIYKDSNLNIRFFINSSDNGNNYNESLQSLDIDVEKFSDFNKFLKSQSEIAIVASCHKSLPKFINATAKQTNVEFISYIDEAHLIDTKANNEDDAIVKIDIDKLCKNSDAVYALTATPNAEVTSKINGWNKFGNGSRAKYIYHVRPIEAINNNIILPPLVKYINCGENDHINIGMLKQIMKDAKMSNPNIKHKILVTLKSCEELSETRTLLEKIGYKVFSTCSAFGYGVKDNVEEGEITQFIDDVENYDDDCFVLHIRQLIQGIDIKALTDCVIFNTSHGSQQHYRHTIQTIGRILRPANGERGKKKDERIKKVGRVYFITPSTAEEARDNIEQFVCRYYGFDNITFEESRYSEAGISNDELFESFKPLKHGSMSSNAKIVELMCNIENYINKQIVPKLNFYMKNSINKFDINKEAEKILNKFDAFGAEYNTEDLLDNKELLDAIVEKLINKMPAPLF